MHRSCSRRKSRRFPILIEDDKIAAIDPSIATQKDEEVDAEGLHLIPGVIDDQVHFREPGLTHKEDLLHASRACAAGGVTTFLEMPNTIPNAITQELLEEKLALGAASSMVNYGFYIGATPDNAEELSRAHRTPGIKIFIGSSTGNLLVDEQEALERIFALTTFRSPPIVKMKRQYERIRKSTPAQQTSAIIPAFVIMKRLSSPLVERLIWHNVTITGFMYCMFPPGIEADFLGDFWRLITAEACPHHLFFNVDDYDRLGSSDPDESVD